ncbi:MAG TPA: hypothetical protein VLM42_00665 [Bryobacteraceae bacterium]|nr:hypothetical protein [Bryobacteraceae bacterium]
MKKQCPQCKRLLDVAAGSCDGCQLSFAQTRPAPKSFTRNCITIAGMAFIAVGVIVTIALHY